MTVVWQLDDGHNAWRISDIAQRFEVRPVDVLRPADIENACGMANNLYNRQCLMGARAITGRWFEKYDAIGLGATFHLHSQSVHQ